MLIMICLDLPSLPLLKKEVKLMHYTVIAPFFKGLGLKCHNILNLTLGLPRAVRYAICIAHAAGFNCISMFCQKKGLKMPYLKI
jgi:hypothetical protein